jgi:hypothetical protein
MQIINLINDWQQDGLYLTQIKTAIALINPDAKIFDFAPTIKPFDEKNAAFILKQSYKLFPENSIHLNFVVNFKNKITDYIIVKYQNQFFVSRDTGFVSLVIDSFDIQKIYKIEGFKHPFPELELYPIIVQAINKNKLDKIAILTDKLRKKIPLKPVVYETQIICHIDYIDSYGNIITDLDQITFYDCFENEKFEIIVGNNINSKITRISTHYEIIEAGKLFAIFNNLGLLEIGLHSGNMVELLSIKKDTEIYIKKVDIKNPKPGQLF